ncbi:hypothetical protein D3C75_359770 [compost metagenome]
MPRRSCACSGIRFSGCGSRSLPASLDASRHSQLKKPGCVKNGKVMFWSWADWRAGLMSLPAPFVSLPRKQASSLPGMDRKQPVHPARRCSGRYWPPTLLQIPLQTALVCVSRGKRAGLACAQTWRSFRLSLPLNGAKRVNWTISWKRRWAGNRSCGHSLLCCLSYTKSIRSWGQQRCLKQNP